MKKYIITLLISLSFSFHSISQVKNGVITYKKVLIKKTFVKKEKNNTNFEQFSFIENKIIEALKEIKFELKFSKNESTFQRVKSLKTENDKFFGLALIPHGSSVFYKDNKGTLEQKNIFGEDFLISKDKLNWKLINESKKIGEYNCLKAVAEVIKPYRGKPKKYVKIAWYSPKINASFGPIGYGGLPGLILELNDGKYKYVASKIKLNLKNNIKLKSNLKGKNITEKEMDLLISEAMGNFKRNKK